MGEERKVEEGKERGVREGKGRKKARKGEEERACRRVSECYFSGTFRASQRPRKKKISTSAHSKNGQTLRRPAKTNNFLPHFFFLKKTVV